MKKIILLTLLMGLCAIIEAQILFTPTGTVGNSSNSFVGIGDTSPRARLTVRDNKRMGISLGGPSTSLAAVADLTFIPFDGQLINGMQYWNWSYRTDSWSSQPGDLVLYAFKEQSTQVQLYFRRTVMWD